MTLGLAVSHNNAIYLAIESQGLPTSSATIPHLAITSKIIELQVDPEIVVLAAGGLDHWAFVAQRYLHNSSVANAVDSVKRLLDSCMGPSNRAFGLLCAIEDSQPVIWRIGREQSTPLAVASIVDSSTVQPLGIDASRDAASQAMDAINRQVHPMVALITSIEGRFELPDTRRPLHVRTVT